LILDTNALSALADGDPEFSRVLGGVETLSLPVIAIGEFRFGVIRSRHRDRYEAWLDELVEVSSVLRVDEETAGHYAGIRESLKKKGRPIPSNDTWIAALAIQYRLAVVSRDSHFDEVSGIKRVSW
jgi:tRNA(fMet)-specific endonuclease VapC